MRQTTVETSHGKIAVADSESGGPTVLMIHGNSSCKEVFRHQFASDIAKDYRILAIDLPGHGASDNPPDPMRTYCLGGYADMVAELLPKIGVSEAAVFGWSLGGHVALEVIGRFPGLKGVMITGSPPVRVSPEGIGAGFKPSPVMGLTGKGDFTREDAHEYTRHTCGVNLPVDPHLLDMAVRTDGQARALMFQSLLEGRGLDEVEIVGHSDVPIAVVNGADDHFVNVPYMNDLKYRNLWDGVLYVAPGIGHALFWEAPKIFNPIFARFLKSVLG
jgi:pimeloyl-ACP methyl ester carboxylesterase